MSAVSENEKITDAANLAHTVHTHTHTQTVSVHDCSWNVFLHKTISILIFKCTH